MKNKFNKYIYIFIILIGIFTTIFLIVHPLKHEVQVVHFNTEDKVELISYNSPVEQVFKVSKDGTFKFVIFLNGQKVYDNLEIILYDSNYNVLKSKIFKSYMANALIIGFDQINAGKYIVAVKDLDNDPVELMTTAASDTAYLKEEKAKTLKFATAHLENNYFYLWYPVFIFAFMFTIYPFVWQGDKNEK